MSATENGTKATVAVPMQRQRELSRPEPAEVASVRRPAGIDSPEQRSWLSRHRSAAALLLLCDAAVLVGYLAVAGTSAPTFAALWVLTALAYHSGGLYQARLHVAILDDLPSMAKRSAVATGFVVAVSDQIGGPGVARFLTLSVVGFAGHVALRSVAGAVIRHARSSGQTTHPTIVVGSGIVSHKMVSTLDAEPTYGLGVLGYVDDRPAEHADQTPGWTYLGTLEDLPDLLATLHATVVLVGYGYCSERSVAELVRSERIGSPSIFVVPRLFEVGRRMSVKDHIGAIPITRPRIVRLQGAAWAVKRAFDVALSLLALTLLSPVLLAVAVAVRWEGGPGIIFRQVRVGRDGKLFDVLKFRSMRPADPNEANVTWNIANDHRVGPVGRIIRKTSLDELPQLVNILKGEMTIVGPRPERPHFVEQFAADHAHYTYRHRVPVGLTGLAQISGLRGDTSIDDRARFDNYYIENWSLWLDVKVIARTVRQVTGARGG